MPQLETRCFGPTAYQSESKFDFPAGLPGFELEKSFIFLKRPDAEPLLFMQSVTTPDLCFMVLPVLAAEPEYQLNLTAEDRLELQLPPDRAPEIGQDIFCGVIVCAGEAARPMATANLLAPVVLNLRRRIGIQAIQADSGYSHQHPLLPREDVSPCS